jgi:hypothetical protein
VPLTGSSRPRSVLPWGVRWQGAAVLQGGRNWDQTLMYGCAYVALLSKFDATDIFKKWLLGARNPISVLFSIQDWSCSMVDLME